MTEAPYKLLWQRVRAALAARGAVPTGKPTVNEIAAHAQAALGTDLVRRFVDQYYQARNFGAAAGALSDEEAERLVASLEALTGAPARPASAEAESTVGAAKATPAAPAPARETEAEAYGASPQTPGGQPAARAPAPAAPAQPLDRAQINDALDLWLRRKFIDRSVFIHARLDAGGVAISDGAMVEFREAIPPSFHGLEKLAERAEAFSEEQVMRALPAVAEYRRDEHVVVAIDPHFSSLKIRTLTARNGRKCDIDGEYLGYVQQRYPRATLYLCEEIRPLMVEEDGTLVAGIMPMHR